MSKYVEKNLGKDEELVAGANVHSIIFIPKAIICAFLMLIAMFGQNSSFFIFMLVICCAIMAKPLIVFFSTKLYFTNKRLLGKVGLINTKVLDTPLNKINNVSIEQGLGGKLFGYGTIVVSSSSAQYNFKGIKNPEVFRSRLMEQIDKFDEDRIKKQAMEMAKAMKETNA